METIVRNTTNGYPTDNNLLCASQQGFRNKYFTVSLLLLSKHNYVHCIVGKAEIDIIFS